MSVHAGFVAPPLGAILVLLSLALPAAWQVEEPPFDYFANSWALIGLKDYSQGTRISPDQELLLDGDVRAKVLLGRTLQPIPRTTVKTLWQGYLPVVQWTLNGPPQVRYSVRAFAAPLLPPPSSALKTSEVEETLYNWPMNGDNYVNVVQVDAVSPGGKPGTLPSAALRFSSGGQPVDLEWEQLRSGLLRGTCQGKTWAIVSVAQSSGSSTFRPSHSPALPLPSPLTFWIPFSPLEDDSGLIAQALQDPMGRQTLEKTAAFWNGLLVRGAKVEVPEKKVLDTYRASLIYQFIGRDREDVHAGEGFYDSLFLRDGSYQVWSLELAGYLAEARQSLEFFLPNQTPEGQFVTQAGQLDAHGYALWALAEHYWLTRDRDWLQAVYPQVRRAVEWLERHRLKEGPYRGLLPAAAADGENLWAGQNHIVGYDFWNLRGLLCAVELARALGHSEEAERWSREAEDYRAAIDAGLKQAGTLWIPPSFEGEGTHWGNLECLFPTPLFPPDDPRVAATLEEVRRRFGGGFVEGTIRWSPASMTAIHPYMSQFATNSELVRGRSSEALEGFYAFLLHTTATHGFPEGVFYRTRTAWGDTVPHLWAAALYVITLRNLLLREFQEELHLSSAVPPHWLAPGKTIRMLNAPTRFGKVSATWHGESDSVSLDLELPASQNVPPQSSSPTAALSAGGMRVTLRDERKVSRQKLPPFVKGGTSFLPLKVTPVPIGGEGRGEALTRVIIHLPPVFQITRATADVGVPTLQPLPTGGGPGRGLQGSSVEVLPQTRHVQIRVRRRTAESWIDFERVVRRYRRAPAPWARPPRGLLKFPLEVPVKVEACDPLDLSTFATTDPFHAPFNVPNPGHYLFTGLPTGLQMAGDIPFLIPDPRAHQGRGLIVLNGQDACSSLPSAVIIPVHRYARRVFFLGNVTGWSPDDPGVGEEGAVAEYVIRYEDGSIQTVPLISGRTVDDWAMPPVASDVFPALRGNPWHLNVLGVQLRDQAVREIEFRDLGTPASPVLVAITLAGT